MEAFEQWIEELEQAIDDDLVQATLDSARRLEHSLALEFAFVGVDERDQPGNERWQVTLTGVAGHRLAFEWVLPRLSTRRRRAG
ncbi:hypothetical protein [Deinococcus alpinitundrae]|uniref:hypothetical protein n=1 Tax=Deinococcus alpinitundrae TaxID=468913 RepID=UPI001379C8FC|nr:hypothetical protein [Deinococcus alpinitundrae]